MQGLLSLDLLRPHHSLLSHLHWRPIHSFLLPAWPTSGVKNLTLQLRVNRFCTLPSTLEIPWPSGVQRGTQMAESFPKESDPSLNITNYPHFKKIKKEMGISNSLFPYRRRLLSQQVGVSAGYRGTSWCIKINLEIISRNLGSFSETPFEFDALFPVGGRSVGPVLWGLGGGVEIRSDSATEILEIH